MYIDHSTRARAHIALAAVAALVMASAVLTFGGSSARADYGPDTCLNGFVWRGAIPTDHVCVTTAIRTQTAADNAQADARRDPNGGPYGPDTCLQGYVWRGVVATDHVCVTPATRSQVAVDNAQAAARRNDVRIAVNTWIPNTGSCDGDVCTKTSDDAPRYRVIADRLNVGSAFIGLYRLSDGRRLWSRWVTVPGKGGPGGVLSYRTDRLRCSGPSNAYFRVMDGSSHRWSARVNVATGCATL
jgi:hypothetical protein